MLSIPSKYCGDKKKILPLVIGDHEDYDEEKIKIFMELDNFCKVDSQINSAPAVSLGRAAQWRLQWKW